MRLLIVENIYYTNIDVFPHHLLSVAYWTVSIIVSSEFQDTSSRKSVSSLQLPAVITHYIVHILGTAGGSFLEVCSPGERDRTK